MYNVMPFVNALEALAVNCLKLDGDPRSHEIRFTDEDLINALIVMNTVVGNRAIHNLIELNAPVHMGNVAMHGYGEMLRTTFHKISGIDPHEYFRNLNKDK